MASEESKQVKESIGKYVKVTGYRNWKLVSPAKLNDLLDEIYDHLCSTHLKLGDEESEYYLSRAEFHRIYAKHSVKCVGERRQYSQSQMKTAGQSALN